MDVKPAGVVRIVAAPKDLLFGQDEDLPAPEPYTRIVAHPLNDDGVLDYTRILYTFDTLYSSEIWAVGGTAQCVLSIANEIENAPEESVEKKFSELSHLFVEQAIPVLWGVLWQALASTSATIPSCDVEIPIAGFDYEFEAHPGDSDADQDEPSI